MRLADIEPGQQPGHLLRIDLDNILIGFRPAEVLFFKTLMPDAKAVFIPEQNFDNLTATIAKGEQAAGERVELKIICHHGAEPID